MKKDEILKILKKEIRCTRTGNGALKLEGLSKAASELSDNNLERQIEKKDQWIGLLQKIINRNHDKIDIDQDIRDSLLAVISELATLKSELSEPEEDDFPEINFRKDIAEELSRDDLINRLCEMNENYQAMRKEWLEKCFPFNPDIKIKNKKI